MTTALTFQNTTFDVVDRNGQPWIRCPQIGDALGYTKGRVSIAKLYETHSDEFTDAMTAVVKLPTEGGEQDVRIFSLRGCHLLAMFARTPVAKKFRKWVLDVLDNLGENETATRALPETAIDELSASNRAKQFRRILKEIHEEAARIGRLMNDVQFTCIPGARLMRLPPELNTRYNVISQLHKTAIAGLYTAEHTLYTLYYMGEGVKFV